MRQVARHPADAEFFERMNPSSTWGVVHAQAPDEAEEIANGRAKSSELRSRSARSGCARHPHRPALGWFTSERATSRCGPAAATRAAPAAPGDRGARRATASRKARWRPAPTGPVLLAEGGRQGRRSPRRTGSSPGRGAAEPRPQHQPGQLARALVDAHRAARNHRLQVGVEVAKPYGKPIAGDSE